MQAMARAAVLISLLASTDGFSAAQHARASRLRTLDGPVPHDLPSAKRLHQRLLSKARAIERVYGHITKPPSYLSTQTMQLSVAADAGFDAPPVIDPSALGGDPSGRSDSTQALEAAVKAVLACGTARAGGHMASGILDLGGATIDLGGGLYNISRPLVFPQLVGNFQIVRGTLRAGPSFPGDRFMIEIGNVSCAPDGQKVCNEFVNLNEIFLDAGHVAAGALDVKHTMGLTLGPSAFVTGFNDAGVRVEGGHEIVISEAWFAEYYWSEEKPATAHSIGIQLSSPDNILSNVIVFDFTKVGVMVGDGTLNDGCNVLEAVHTWNGLCCTVLYSCSTL
jgi:hypothetical protein